MSYSPDQALSILAQMADRAPGNGPDHRAVVEAVRVLTAAITPSELPPPPDAEAP